MISAIMLPLVSTLSQDMLKLSGGTKFEIFPDCLIRAVCKYSIFSLLSQISYLSSSGFSEIVVALLRESYAFVWRRVYVS